MACQTNQLGSIVSTSRETLDEGKGNKPHNINQQMEPNTHLF
jgi:hypothetical protein